MRDNDSARQAAALEIAERHLIRSRLDYNAKNIGSIAAIIIKAMDEEMNKEDRLEGESK